MGNGAAFSVGRFDEYRTVKYVAGVRVITKTNKKVTEPDNTPMHSHSANTMYAKRDTKTKKIDQVAVYQNHSKVKDIDIGHVHKQYKETDIHVHDYVNGKRSQKARNPTEQEKRILEEVRRQDNE